MLRRGHQTRGRLRAETATTSTSNYGLVYSRRQCGSLNTGKVKYRLETNKINPNPCAQFSLRRRQEDI
jgi:hypothetical protein